MRQIDAVEIAGSLVDGLVEGAHGQIDVPHLDEVGGAEERLRDALAVHVGSVARSGVLDGPPARSAAQPGMKPGEQARWKLEQHPAAAVAALDARRPPFAAPDMNLVDRLEPVARPAREWIGPVQHDEEIRPRRKGHPGSPAQTVFGSPGKLETHARFL